MAKVTISLYGRDYPIQCEDGAEARLQEIAGLVDEKIRQIAGNVGTTVTEPRLFMLACLMLGNEVLEQKEALTKLAARTTLPEEEEILVAAVEHLRQKVVNLASEAGRA